MNRTPDVRAVKAVVEAYAKGTATRDIDLLKQAFHPQALMSGYFGPDLLVGGPEPFYAQLEGNPHPDDSYAHDIVEISVTGSTAVARLIEDNLYGLSFVNDFHLLKQDGKWSIVSKLFHHD